MKKPRKPKNLCPDCAVKPGVAHHDGCDVERCSVCGLQKIGCECEGHDKQFSRWTGFWPGELESEMLGMDLNQFYEKYFHKIFFTKTGLAELRRLAVIARKTKP